MTQRPSRSDVASAVNNLYVLPRTALIAVCDTLMIPRPLHKASRAELIDLIENEFDKLRQRGRL